jgi:hypothetical protein
MDSVSTEFENRCLYCLHIQNIWKNNKKKTKMNSKQAGEDIF